MDRRERTLCSLDGLSVGDAFGETFFSSSPQAIVERLLPQGTWQWTDDTAMAISIVEVLLAHGEIDQDALASAFVDRYVAEPWRGYGGGAHRLLRAIGQGADWRDVAQTLFNGGSWGNGGAMRAAPIGAYFAGDPERAAEEARKSAQITHAHVEGQAGAMAVAVAAALLGSAAPPTGNDLLKAILAHVPDTRTQAGIERAMDFGAHEQARAAATLGTGASVAAFDTVPYCVWVVAHYAHDYPAALWTTVAGLGDRDTTCAIVGGIVAVHSPVPEMWLVRREPLPAMG